MKGKKLGKFRNVIFYRGINKHVLYNQERNSLTTEFEYKQFHVGCSSERHVRVIAHYLSKKVNYRGSFKPFRGLITSGSFSFSYAHENWVVYIV